MKEKKCEECGAKVSRYATRCMGCRNTENYFTRKQKSVDKKWLVRGLPSAGNRVSNIEAQA